MTPSAQTARPEAGLEPVPEVGLVLTSPVTGAALRAETPYALAGPSGERWPMVDGIPYLRVGRDALVKEALRLLDAGGQEDALVLLLGDQDDWWTGPPAEARDLRALVRERSALSLRDAVARLGWGRVGDYFVHRWSDPTYLAGLALLEAHWRGPETVFELACGIGHYLGELQVRGVAVAGADVVFAKLWVARHWVLPEPAALVCFDAAAPWPIEPRVGLAMCHDAFYFLEPKRTILERLRGLAGDAGWLALGHIHNAERPGLSAGRPLAADEIAGLFPDGVVYDDAELTRALVEARAPVPQPAQELRQVEAFSVACGPGLDPVPRPLADGLALPRAGTQLRRNPLYASAPDGWRIGWPSDRYEAEYGPRATYRPATDAPATAVSGPATDALARRRELVALPERW